jgi:hypothetical protein
MLSLCTAKRKVEETNLIYIKLPKASGTTTAYAIRRIAALHNISGSHTFSSHYGTSDVSELTEPLVWASASPAILIEKDRVQLKKKCFQFSMVRDPADRAISQFYHFEMSLKNKRIDNETEKLLINFLNSMNNFLFNYLKTSKSDTPKTIFEKYSLLGVTELYSETMVLLADKLQIPLMEVLYETMNESSGHTVHAPPKSTFSARLNETIENFKVRQTMDNVIYKQARENIASQFDVSTIRGRRLSDFLNNYNVMQKLSDEYGIP